MIRLIFNISTIIEIWGLLFYLVFVYPSGKNCVYGKRSKDLTTPIFAMYSQ